VESYLVISQLPRKGLKKFKNHSVQIEDFEKTPLLMPNLDESHNGPAIQHSIRVLDTAVKQLTVIVTVTSPFGQFSDPIHDQFSVSVISIQKNYILLKVDFNGEVVGFNGTDPGVVALGQVGYSTALKKTTGWI